MPANRRTHSSRSASAKAAARRPIENAHVALSVARRAYVLETGRIVLEGKSEAIREDPQVRAAYLGSS